MSGHPRAEDILERIAASVNRRLEERRQAVPFTRLREQAQALTRKPLDFESALRVPGVRIIAEVKLESPSEGRIARGQAMSPIPIARDYVRNGAAALSVLTERDHFGGSPEFLRAIREELPGTPLLMKDFILDEYQLFEARVLGADSVLLIVALLGQARTREFLKLARELELAALVEVHDEPEMSSAIQAGASLIGVNNRNLKTLEVSLETSHRLAKLAPSGATLVAESGIRDGAEIRGLQQDGYHAFLVGTSLIRTGKPGEALARLMAEAGE